MSKFPSSITYKELYRLWFKKLTQDQQASALHAAFGQFQSTLEIIERTTQEHFSSLQPRTTESTSIEFDSAPRIVIADATPANLALLKLVLEHEGYHVWLTDNGKTALSLIETHTPDLVLINVNTPELNGYEVTRRLRSDARFVYLPVMLITACSPTDVETELESGANDIIPASFNVQDLLLKIRILCN